MVRASLSANKLLQHPAHPAVVLLMMRATEPHPTAKSRAPTTESWSSSAVMMMASAESEPSPAKSWTPVVMMIPASVPAPTKTWSTSTKAWSTPAEACSATRSAAANCKYPSR